jgi:hypothetical protein
VNEGISVGSTSAGEGSPGRLAVEAQQLSSLNGGFCVRANSPGFGIVDLNFEGDTAPERQGSRSGRRLFSAYGPWRVETRDRVVVGSDDLTEEIRQALQTLVGKRVLLAFAQPPGYMAQLRFEDDLILWTFPTDVRQYGSGHFEEVGGPWFVADPS